jgi:O-antigen/teichoic acid export membrane protein
VCDAWRFGRNMWISSNSEGVLKDLDDTAVGTLGDTEALGYYSRAYKLSRLFIEFIAPAIVRTSFPMYSNLKDDPRALASVFGIVQRFLARMAALFYLEIGLLAPAVIALLYGEQWLPMVQLFRLMTVYAFLQPLFDQHVQVLLASNRPHILARIRLAQMAFFVPGVFIAAYIWGALGVAIVVDVMALLGMCLVIVQTRKLVAVSLTPIFVPSAVGAFVSLVAFWGVQLLWQTESYLVALLAFVPLIAIVFVGCLFVSEGKTLVGDIQRIRRGLLGASGV